MSFLRVNDSIGPKNGIEGIPTGTNSHEIIIPGKNLNVSQLKNFQKYAFFKFNLRNLNEQSSSGSISIFSGLEFYHNYNWDDE